MAKIGPKEEAMRRRREEQLREAEERVDRTTKREKPTERRRFGRGRAQRKVRGRKK